jgi:cytochrome c
MRAKYRSWTLAPLALMLPVAIAAISQEARVDGAQAIARSVSSSSAAPGKPDDSRFTVVTLVPPGELDEPMVFQVLQDGRVLIIERKGVLKMYDPATKRTRVVAKIPVNTKYTNAAGVQREAEEGLIGLTVDPNFAQNGWIYMLYADPAVTKHVLARWELRGDALVEDSKKVLLEYGVQRETCCHTGGGMTWDRNGNLYLTIGNNTGNSQGMQSDERPGRSSWDDQRGSANTNDLRGKIIRIHPEPDGTYTIPPGNLFAPGTPGTRPEIYVMGLRNAWRPFLDSRTGYLYWGEVGPDAQADTELGSRGYDEHNQARGPGFFGWPYFIGENHRYPYYDYAQGRALQPKDPARPTNTSVNNTGLRELPPAQPAFISYPYALSERFPDVGSGARSANGGPVYHRADFTNPARPFPSYYEGKLLISDLSRGWIMAVTMDENSNYVSMERFLPSYRPVEIIDNKFGPDGDFYVLEYGSVWFARSDDSRLVRIEYNGGNRAPVVETASSRLGGVPPFQATLSAAGTTDPDGDRIAYSWTVATQDGGNRRTFNGPQVTIPFERPGVYTATLTATDPAGASSTKAVTIVAGNEPPAVTATLTGGNRTFFFFDKPVNYSVQVTEREDGAVTPAQVAVAVDYIPEGFDVAAVRTGRAVDPTTRFAVAQSMMAKTSCRTCHDLERRSAGPSFHEIADRYRGEAAAVTRLAAKVREGGSGVWGTAMMPAHPTLSAYEAQALVQFMLGGVGGPTLPLTGTYTPTLPEGEAGTGRLLLRAAYTDRGAGSLPPLTSDAVATLRSQHVAPASADVRQNVNTRVENRGAGPISVLPKAGSHIGFREWDLTGITRIDVAATAAGREPFSGGTIEVRLGSPTGQVIGRANVPVPVPAGGGTGGAPVGPPQGAGTPPVRIAVTPTSGTHDVYFVFQNTTARPSDQLFQLTRITVSETE